MTIGDLKNNGFNVNEQILDIWRDKKYYDNITKGSILPLQYPDDYPVGREIVFIGMNPSFQGVLAFDSLLHYDQLEV